jgi:hypothetical protein
MIRTLISILVTLLIIAGLTITEIHYVKTTFSEFTARLQVLMDKAFARTATADDGDAVREFWENKKNTLYVWLPHAALTEIDFQLDEAIGNLYVKDFDSAISKIEVVICLSEDIPQSYSIGLENIF